MAKEEKTEVGILVTALVGVVNAGMDLLENFLIRRIQPLQARAHPMWQYEGPNLPTRVHPEELAEKDVGAKIKAITCFRDNPRSCCRPSTKTCGLSRQSSFAQSACQHVVPCVLDSGVVMCLSFRTFRICSSRFRWSTGRPRM